MRPPPPPQDPGSGTKHQSPGREWSPQAQRPTSNKSVKGSPWAPAWPRRLTFNLQTTQFALHRHSLPVQPSLAPASVYNSQPCLSAHAAGRVPLKILPPRSLLWTPDLSGSLLGADALLPGQPALCPLPSALTATLSSQLFSPSVILRMTPSPSVTGPKYPQTTGTGFEPVGPPRPALPGPPEGTPMEVRGPLGAGHGSVCVKGEGRRAPGL